MEIERSQLQSVAERLQAEFGAVCSTEANFPMLDVRLGGELFVLDYDNGPTWQPRGLIRVAHVTEDYAFNMSNDPSFATLEEAERYLKEALARLVPNKQV